MCGKCGRPLFDSMASLPTRPMATLHAFRTALDRMGLRYAVGVASRLTVQVTGARRRYSIRRVMKRLPVRAWRRICWAQGTKGPLAARFAALRVRSTARGPEARPLTKDAELDARLLAEYCRSLHECFQPLLGRYASGVHDDEVIRGQPLRRAEFVEALARLAKVEIHPIWQDGDL